tara:strand:- start:71463 stop:71582 length:120 start_codon:yes stop_codon:yes gene_type:complete
LQSKNKLSFWVVALFCFSVYLGFQVENPQVKIILAKKWV